MPGVLYHWCFCFIYPILFFNQRNFSLMGNPLILHSEPSKFSSSPLFVLYLSVKHSQTEKVHFEVLGWNIS